MDRCGGKFEKGQKIPCSQSFHLVCQKVRMGLKSGAGAQKGPSKARYHIRNKLLEKNRSGRHSNILGEWDKKGEDGQGKKCGRLACAIKRWGVRSLSKLQELFRTLFSKKTQGGECLGLLQRVGGKITEIPRPNSAGGGKGGSRKQKNWPTCRKDEKQREKKTNRRGPA